MQKTGIGGAKRGAREGGMEGRPPFRGHALINEPAQHGTQEVSAWTEECVQRGSGWADSPAWLDPTLPSLGGPSGLPNFYPP